MTAALWLKTETAGGYRGQFRKPIEWDDNGRPMSDFRDGAGRPARDRIPAIGFDGTDIRNMRPIRGVRHFVDYLRHDGHIGHIKMTNAAAHVPNEDESCRRDRVLKAKHFGWIEWASTGISKCPCMMVLAGEINPEQLLAPACRGVARTEVEKMSEAVTAAAWAGPVAPAKEWWGRPCDMAVIGAGKPPCIHAIAERIARRAARMIETENREERVKSEEAKAALALADSARAQTAAANRQATALQNLAERMEERITTAKPEPKK